MSLALCSFLSLRCWVCLSLPVSCPFMVSATDVMLHFPEPNAFATLAIHNVRARPHVVGSLSIVLKYSSSIIEVDVNSTCILNLLKIGLLVWTDRKKDRHIDKQAYRQTEMHMYICVWERVCICVSVRANKHIRMLYVYMCMNEYVYVPFYINVCYNLLCFWSNIVHQTMVLFCIHIFHCHCVISLTNAWLIRTCPRKFIEKLLSLIRN